MVKYYIKITNEKPLDDDSALWFELESDEETGKADFFVLDRNEYTALVNKFGQVQQSYETASANFNDTVIEEIVAPAVTSYMNTLEGVENATNLVDSEDNSKYYDYSALNEALEDLETTKLDISSVDSSLSASSTNPVQNSAIMSALNGKANTSDVTSLQSTVNGKASASHTHTGWTKLELNNYSSIYYNNAIKMCYFRYYRESYTFTKTDVFSLHNGLIPSTYRPHGDIVLPFYHYHLIGRIDSTTGHFYIKSDTKTSYAINTSAMWSYK